MDGDYSLVDEEVHVHDAEAEKTQQPATNDAELWRRDGQLSADLANTSVWLCDSSAATPAPFAAFAAALAATGRLVRHHLAAARPLHVLHPAHVRLGKLPRSQLREPRGRARVGLCGRGVALPLVRQLYGEAGVGEHVRATCSDARHLRGWQRRHDGQRRAHGRRHLLRQRGQHAGKGSGRVVARWSVARPRSTPPPAAVQLVAQERVGGVVVSGGRSDNNPSVVAWSGVLLWSGLGWPRPVQSGLVQSVLFCSVLFCSGRVSSALVWTENGTLYCGMAWDGKHGMGSMGWEAWDGKP
eukprot:359586-Chlamydomonas_euryale.AAC.29